MVNVPHVANVSLIAPEVLLLSISQSLLQNIDRCSSLEHPLVCEMQWYSNLIYQGPMLDFTGSQVMQARNFTTYLRFVFIPFLANQHITTR